MARLEENKLMRNSVFKKISRANKEMFDLIQRKEQNIEFANEDNWDITDAHILNCIDELNKYKSMLNDLKD